VAQGINELISKGRHILAAPELPFGFFAFTKNGIIDLSLDVLRYNFSDSIDMDGGSFSVDFVWRMEYLHAIRPNDYFGISELYDPEREQQDPSEPSSMRNCHSRWAFIGMVSGITRNVDKNERYMNVQGQNWGKLLANTKIWQDPTLVASFTALKLLSAGAKITGSMRDMIISSFIAWMGHKDSPQPAMIPPMKQLFSAGSDYTDERSKASQFVPTPILPFRDQENFARNVTFTTMHKTAGRAWNGAAVELTSSFTPQSNMRDILASMIVPALNELWFSVAYPSWAPHGVMGIYMRQRPYSKADWNALQTHTIWENEIVNQEVGFSAGDDLANLVMIHYGGKDFDDGLALSMWKDYQAPIDPRTGLQLHFPLKDEESINQNGVRPLVQETPWVYGGDKLMSLPVFPQNDDELWEAFMQYDPELKKAVSAPATTEDLTVEQQRNLNTTGTVAERTENAAAVDITAGFIVAGGLSEEDALNVPTLVNVLEMSYRVFDWNRFNETMASGTIQVPYRFQRPGRKLLIRSLSEPGYYEEYYIQSRSVSGGRKQPTMCNLSITRGLLKKDIDRFGDIRTQTLSSAKNGFDGLNARTKK
jgi:hypothetical protein